MPSDDKPKLTTGTVTIDVSMPSLDREEKISRILVKSGHNFWIKQRDRQVILKGKDIDTKKILSQMKEVDKSACIHSISEDKKPVVHTTEIKFEHLCCEDNAKTIKSKLGALEGISDVDIDVKLKKVTVKGKLTQKEVLEAANKIGKASLWTPNKTDLKFPNLCCEAHGKMIKSKLESVEGISEVIVDAKTKKVTVKGKISDRQVLDEAEKVGKVEIWK